MPEENKKILVVAVHPDDEVLGCGATIAKYAQDREVHILILGEGLTARGPSSGQGLLELKEKAKKAGAVLGVKKVLFFDLPDQKFDTLPFLEIVQKVEQVIKEIKPSTVFTHSNKDLNLDHRLTFQAVLTASRPVNSCPVREIYSFEIPSSTEWSLNKINGCFSPNVFEDINSIIDKKIEALNIYDTEMRDFPHPRSKEGILTMAKKWGMAAGLNYVEAFELIKKINEKH